MLKKPLREEGNDLFLVDKVSCNGLKFHHGRKSFLMVTLVRHSVMLLRVQFCLHYWMSLSMYWTSSKYY